MRFFCSQPDIVEDVHTVRYHTKSSAGAVGSFLPPSSTSTRLPPSTRILNGRTKSKSKSTAGSVISDGLRHTKSRTGTTRAGTGTTMGKKLFGERKGSLNVGRPATATTAASVSISPAGISAPIPIHTSMPVEMAMPMGLEAGKMGLLHASPPPMIVSTRNLDLGDAPLLPPPSSALPPPAVAHPIQNPLPTHLVEKPERGKGNSLDMGVGAAASATGAGMVTDSERESGPGMAKQLRRKSRRMSAPLAALGINIANIGNFANGVVSGTDTDATVGGKRKRVSKVMIGAPEGFKHVGTGDGEDAGGERAMGFTSAPEVPELWSVEAWRAEIERTLSSARTPPSPSRPKGPRPTSGSNQVTSDTETTISNVAGPTAHPSNIPAYANYMPPRNRRRGSVDGVVVQRRSIDGYATERRSNESRHDGVVGGGGGGERRSNESTGGGRSNEGYGGASGAMTDAPIGVNRSAAVPNRARSGTGGSGGSSHRRSRSGSGSQAHGQGQPQSQSQSQSQVNGNGNGNGSIGRAGGMGYGHSSPLGNSNGNMNAHHGRLQSSGLGHSHSLSQPHSHSHSHSHSNVQHAHNGHVPGKGSITSVGSIPTSTSASTAHTTAILTPNTTSSSLGRSLSEKPYHPPNFHHHHHHHHTISNGSNSNSNGNGNGHYQQQQLYHSHLAHLAQSHHPYYHNNSGAAQFGMNNVPQGGGSVILHRSSSATAALPPSSTSSSATVGSMTSITSSLTAYAGAGSGNSNNHHHHANANSGYGSGSGTGTSTRKPIPAQRRKPVPQHLPATAEVSPFPTLLIVNGPKDADGKRASIPFVLDGKKEREAMPDKGVDVDSAGAGAGAGDGDGDGEGPPPVPSKVQKEMVPLLGVPGDEAHYVTKSTKARFDGAMAEIANALRDPHAEPPL